MSFLRRLFGGGASDPDGALSGAAAERDGPSPGGTEGPGAALEDATTADEEERARELELARFDQERIDDLVRRQQRYADRKWTPPDQGGERRADDADDGGGG